MDKADNGLPIPRRYWAQFSVATGLFVTVADAAMVVLVLPLISDTYGVPPSTVIWVMTAYQLTMACLVLQAAAISERFWHWRVFCGGLALFGAASLFCALSTSLPMLIFGRVLQGIGASAVHAIAMALTRLSYPREQFGRAQGVNASVVGISTASGPVIGALILSMTDWRGVFFVGIPFIALSLIAGIMALPRMTPTKSKLDLVSAGLLIVAMSGLMLTLRELGEDFGLLLPVAAILTVGCIVLLVRRQKGVVDPIFPVDLIRMRPIALTTAANLCMFSAQALTFVSVTFHLRLTTDFSVPMIGLLITPWPVGVAIMASFSGRLSDTYPNHILCTIGTVITLAGTIALLMLPEQTGPFDVAWRMLICGMGFGLFNTPNNRTAIMTAPQNRTTAAGALLAICRLTGQSLGTATSSIAFAHWAERGGLIGFGCAAFFLALATVFSGLKSRG
jgi:DHA2 family multidrug resistance protein-like MFS transporter